jgi:hypothetical protein
MKTEPLFVIPDALSENRRPERIEEKPRIRRELPKKSFEKDEGKEKSEEVPDKKKNKIPPPNSLGGTIDISA